MIPSDFKYTKEHEWVKIDGNIASIGITDYAAGELGDIVFVEVPKVGTKVQQTKPFGTIEAVKAISDLFSPLSGEVVEVNGEVAAEAAVINKDPYGHGWIIKIKYSNAGELDTLLSAADYEALLKKI
ncbi:MAG: glycine cleavage system protein H [candidate division Zixibacteria bacterium RBG_16_53_22]|nr:MAG: glycine cleavage system protein H [candidate division Zixibacteria bacterium RBG_16_53_22]